MKTVRGFLVVFIIIGIVYAAARFFNCGLVRDYTVSSDKKIEDIKEKIAALEKDDIKDLKTVERLADQYTMLGTIYLEKRLWDMAIENYAKGIKYGKNTPGVFYSIGLAYANRGSERNSREDIDRAYSYYTQAVDIQDNFYDAQNALAILLFYHKDDKERGLTIIKNVVMRNKKHYIARFTLGRMYYDMNNPEKALQVYEDLNTDLEKLPPSEIINEYKVNCKQNIHRIMSELSPRQKK
jgi:tetratricopeptide (TPR) repeat protein